MGRSQAQEIAAQEGAHAGHHGCRLAWPVRSIDESVALVSEQLIERETDICLKTRDAGM
jgi:hypothetical protein